MTASIDTTRTAARPGICLGSGRTVVAVHGAISDHRSWLPCAHHLAADFQVIAFTQRGFGAEAGEPLDFDAHVADLIKIATEAKHPVHVMGWSHGCDVALAAMLRQPELFVRAVLFEPSIASIMSGDPVFAEAEKTFHASLAPAITNLRQGRIVEAALAFGDATCGGRPREADELVAIVRDNASSIGPFMAMKPRPRPAVEQLRQPLLVLNGANSPLRYRLIGQRLAERALHGSHAIIAGASHDGPWRAAERVAELALEFLRPRR